jgi:hypothetical protein
MVLSGGINYRDTFFETPELTKIQGEPSPDSISKMLKELKANAQSVFSNLSDGRHGHLFLVITAAELATITALPFIRPVFPGQLQIPAGTTGPMATTLKEAHQEATRLFREVQGVEAALIQQIIKAVDPPYLLALRDRISNSLNGRTVSEIFEHLRSTYGRVSIQMLDERAEELRKTEYDPTQAIDIVFTTVEDFVNLSYLGHQPMTGPQTVAKAYLILNRSGKFKEEVKRWNDLPHAAQTWDAFKTHFRRAHVAFRETTNVTLEQSELARSHANLVQQVVTGMQAAMAAEAQPVANQETQDMFLHMSNSAAQASEAQLHLQHQLAQMQQHMQVMQAQMTASNSQPRQPVYPPPNYNPGFFPNQQQQQPTGGGGFQGPSGFGGRGQGRGYQGHQPGRGRGGYQGFQPYNQQQMQGQQQPHYQQQHGGQQQQRGYQGRGQGRGYQGRGQGGRSGGIRSFNCYCWTHGAGAHPSPDCRTPTQGHQIGATFENKMGGSMRYCQPAAT